MRVRFVATILVFLAFATALPAQQKDVNDYPQRAPFDMLRWKDEKPEVKVDDTWYTLHAIDKVTAAKLIEFSKKRCGDRWAKRICEDLVFLMSEMGHPPGGRVDLSVTNLTTNKKTILKSVAMTSERRQALHAASPRPGSDPKKRDPKFLRKLAPRAIVAEASPFEMVRFRGYAPEVQLDGTWYGLLAVDGISTRDLLRFCRKRYEGRWAERFCEDFVRMLRDMGRPAANTVTLTLKDLQTKRATTIKEVPLSAANRQLIKRAEPFEGIQPMRSTRDKRTPDRAKFKFLTRRYHDNPDKRLTAEQAAEDLDELEWLLTHRFSYLTLRKVDYRAALDTIRAALADGIALADFHIQLRKLVALFGDGHARVRGVPRNLPRGYLPFPVVALGDKVVALQRRGTRLLAAKAPYLEEIDGRPIQDFLAAAARLNAAGSPQLVHRQATEYLTFLAYLRKDLGLPANDRVQIRSSSKSSGASGSQQWSAHKLLDQPVRQQPRRRGTPRVLKGNVGYLPIQSMDDEPRFLAALRQAMTELADTQGLIIDVRGNGGGSRHALRTLLPYFMNKGDAPRVVNVATYRLTPTDAIDVPAGYMQNRFLYPKTWSSWNEAQLAAINAATRSFKPRWTPRVGSKGPAFSALHYMLVGPSTDPAVYHYAKPLILLIDSGCFSATDIFVGAFHGLPNVTVMGTPTGGGSGRSQSRVLYHSELEVKLSSMVSYRPDGRLYDGEGIAPDKRAEPTLQDVLGKSDSVRELARKRLSEK